MFIKVAYSILFIFFAVMAAVTFKCYARKSGSTGQDVATIQKIRSEALAENP